MMTSPESQLADTVLMVRPVRFQQNPLTAESNAFMQDDLDASPSEQQHAAEREFENLRTALESAGVRTLVFEDTREPHTPDSIFPNNWVTFHPNGAVVLYPMEAPNRRTERRLDIIDRLKDEHGFDVRKIIDLSRHENEGRFLEGTGSLVLDRASGVAYACLSSRTHPAVLDEFAAMTGFEVVAFNGIDRNGIPIYHTNVMTNVGEVIAAICLEAIVDPEERADVIERLQASGHEILALSFDQLDAFAGNMLELRNAAGERVIAMSESAFDSLRPDQQDMLRANGLLAIADIHNIEQSAGGSVRCMLAEVHLPRLGNSTA